MSKQTNGLIGSGAPVVKTNPDTLALLASSLYYRAGWEREFSPALTEKNIFTNAAGRESRVDFMHRTQSGSFLRRENWQAAQLGTSLGHITFVLPDEGISPESLLQNPDFLSELDFSAEHTIYGEVQWSVPKFDVDSSLDLLDALKAMGVTDLTDMDRADLTALTDLDAFLSEAKQLARVKVDEEGVEAAAVTMMMNYAGSAAGARRGLRHGPGPALPVRRHSRQRPAALYRRCKSAQRVNETPPLSAQCHSLMMRTR